MLKRLYLLLVPLAIVVRYVWPEDPLLIFAAAVFALVPLAALLGESTEHLAAHVGQASGGLLNATFGNLAELIILITMLSMGLHEVVLWGIFGAIFANALLATGLAMFAGGLKFHIQNYNREGTRDLATLLAIAIFGMLAITVIEWSIPEEYRADTSMSLVVSLFLVAGYLLYLVYSMWTHKELFKSVPILLEGRSWSLPWSATVLAVVTIFVVWMSEILSSALEVSIKTLDLSAIFVGAVVIAVIGAAAEIASAVRASRNDRMDLALSISMGASVQIALFVAPTLVFASYFVGPRPFHLSFSYESVFLLFFAAMITGQLARDGRSTWFKGALLVIVYLIVAAGAFLLT